MTEEFRNKIIEDELDETLYQLKLIFTSGLAVYIRYNEFNEYAYQLIYSLKKNDYVRFDNFDDRWDVNTKPHHFHPKNRENAKESPMIGDPKKDMTKLISFIKDTSIY